MSEVVPVTSGLFSSPASGEGRLLGGFCAACERHHFPRFPTCPYCAAEACEERALGQHGTLWLFTAVTSRPPGYRGEVPFGFGVVELPEGIRIITRLTEPRLERLRLGMPMRLVFPVLHVDDEGREVITYAFAPVEDAEARR